MVLSWIQEVSRNPLKQNMKKHSYLLVIKNLIILIFVSHENDGRFFFVVVVVGLVCFCLFRDWVSCTPSWPWTFHVAKDLNPDSSASNFRVVGKGMCRHFSLFLGLESKASCRQSRNSANWATFPAGWKLLCPLYPGKLEPRPDAT